MTSSLFIVTHAKDAHWLDYCLQSIDRFATGFQSTIVVAPDIDRDIIGPICDPYEKVRFFTFKQAPEPLGHLHHIAVKLSADLFGEPDGYRIYIDSDCIFREPVTPDDYFVDGQPILMVHRYDQLPPGDAAMVWKEGTEQALGFEVDFETMRAHPAVHHCSVIKACRRHIETKHRTSLVDYVLAQKPTFPCGANDFNTIGSYALAKHRLQYHIIDLTNHPERRPKSKLIQFWSHSPPDKPQDVWHDGELLRGVIPKKMIKEILK